jgi:hypothetical protein
MLTLIKNSKSHANVELQKKLYFFGLKSLTEVYKKHE